MRYDNWDIILFPEESDIPVQEYRTACYFTTDEDGPELPTLRTYIGSLKSGTPFRISVHHWGPPKPSLLIQELQRRTGKAVTFTVQVFIDNKRQYHGSFELNGTSPQEIAHEQRSFKSSKSNGPPSSHAKQSLLFPKPHEDAILQSSTWQPRGKDNRIQVILSEGLVNEDGTLDGKCWDIVCFAFQYAPRGLLEEAGIAYPIIDPLRSLTGERANFTAQSFPRNTMARELQQGSRIHSELSQDLDVEHMRPPNPEPYQQPTRMLSALGIAEPPQYMMHRGGGIPGIWKNSYGSLIKPENDVNIASWPAQRYGSNMSGLEGYYDPSGFPYTVPPWVQHTAFPEQHPNGNRSGRDKSAHHDIMTWRDHQFGQNIEAISPSQKHRNLPQESFRQRSTQTTRQPAAQSHRPPKMGALSVPIRPSSAAIARTTSYPDLNATLRNISKKSSSDQVNCNPNASTRSHPQQLHNLGKKEGRDATQTSIPTSHSVTTRIPTPNPFMLDLQRWDSDVYMRDRSSNFSSLSGSEVDPAKAGSKAGPAHAPSAVGDVKSRKKGVATESSDLQDTSARHDGNLLTTTGAISTTQANFTTDNPDEIPRNKSNSPFTTVPRNVEVIDVDAIEQGLIVDTIADLAKLSPFKPGHKSGMSSVSSTGRLERQLYSALGEELGSFEQQLETTSMGPELAHALAGAVTHNDRNGSTMPEHSVSELEAIGKRKRQGTLGGGRDPSPLKKKEKPQQAMVDNDDVPAEMPRLRGN